MNYPLISEYIEAIRFAEDNFKELSSLRPVLDSNGTPVMSSGNFAVVFKMKDENSGKFYAVKCFIKEQEGRDESYRKIAEELDTVTTPYILPLRYLEKELFVDSKQCEQEELPVVVMEWVEGETLDAYFRKNLQDSYALKRLSYRFNQMAAWLLAQSFAHGDLKLDNILVRKDGSLVLVDYDGMFVPAMKGEKAREMGSPDYRHPLRTEADFNEHIDDFSIAAIALSLKAISLKPEIRQISGTSDTLLLKEADFRDAASSAILKELLSLTSDKDFKILWGIFWLALAQNSLDDVAFRLFRTEKPKKSEVIVESIRTDVTDKDLAEAIRDEYGVLYSPDGKRLIKGNSVLKAYSVKPGTLAICDDAFRHCELLTTLNIPDTVTSIGNSAFRRCASLNHIEIPEMVTTIGDSVFRSCRTLRNIKLPDIITSIGNSAFEECESLENIHLPDTVTSIGNSAFESCMALESINIPNTVISIGDSAFEACTMLTSICLPNTVTSIRKGTFDGCTMLTSIRLPNTITSIGDCAFRSCGALVSLHLPETVTTIGSSAFSYCRLLTSIYLPETIASIGENPFAGCHIVTFKLENNPYYKVVDGMLINKDRVLIAYLKNQKAVEIPETITSIGDSAFSGCASLVSIKIPDTVTSIGNSAFSYCGSLTSIRLSDTITSIGKYVFRGCESLASIHLPDTVTSIGDYAFASCRLLVGIHIPDMVTSIGNCAFWGCRALGSIYIPDTVSSIGDNAFIYCESLMSIHLPEAITSIRNGVFWGCTMLASIHLPDMVTSIGNSAFLQCRSLTSINLPNALTSIGSATFERCGALVSLHIPDTVTSIGDSAFKGCTSLKVISIPDDVGGNFLECCKLPPHCEVIRRKVER